MGGGGGGGHQSHGGRRYRVGINVCHPELVKFQQQCQCRILFLIYPPNGSILFFSRRESANISWRQQQENWKEKWKWQSSEKVFFNHYINLWVFHDIRSSFRVQTCIWRNWNNLQKGCFYIVVSQGNSGNKVENGNFLIWSQIIVLNLVCSMFLVNKGTIS